MAASSAPSVGFLPRTVDARRTRFSDHARSVTSGRVYALLVAACLVVAALTLLFPSTPTYDPWAWIVWGRDIRHLSLVTAGGPSWKPLPVVFTTVFSFFGGAAPALWVVVGRAGMLLAFVMTFRLSYRLTADFQPLQTRARLAVGRVSVPGLLAAVVGVVGLAACRDFVRTETLANSEGLLVALGLWAVERHLDGRHRQAFVLGFLAALLRPEVWLFIGVYGLWLMVRAPAQRRLVVVLGVLIPVLWFVPELIGSGNLFRASQRATENFNAGSPALTANPGLTILKTARHVIVLATKIGAGVAGAVAIVSYALRRAEAGVLGVGLLSLAWVGLVAVMTQAGYSGNQRYLIMGLSGLVVLSGVGWGRIVQVLAGAVGQARPRGRLAPGVAVVLALAALPLLWVLGTGQRMQALPPTFRALRYQAELRQHVGPAIRAAGGASRVVHCGTISSGKFQVPMLAWHLGVHFERVHIDAHPTGTIFQTRATGSARLTPPVPPGGSYRAVGTAGPWHLYATPTCTTPGA